ncbi:hypothetical protein E2C01_097070 [Portunus trituberculatus]|uniref:Uncharacterized protein n=1 Tax=Portunus trituberculatus TaxID=210409 RepID=A0A5B7K8J9_PORTR|nr:hypothetical protein [Portunus trituberculatus]
MSPGSVLWRWRLSFVMNWPSTVVGGWADASGKKIHVNIYVLWKACIRTWRRRRRGGGGKTRRRRRRKGRRRKTKRKFEEERGAAEKKEEEYKGMQKKRRPNSTRHRSAYKSV